MRYILRDQFASVAAAIAGDSGTAEAWHVQFEVARTSVLEAADFFDQSLLRLTATAKSVNQLFGESISRVNNPRRQLLDEQGAATVFSHLRALGRNLATERRRQDKERTRNAEISRLGGGGRRARAWPPVDTTIATLYATSDTDLLRTLGFLLPSGAAGAHEGPEGVYARDPETGEWVLQRAARPERRGPTDADLMHGGEDGAFVRDPVTGRWVSSYVGRAHEGPQGIDRSNLL